MTFVRRLFDPYIVAMFATVAVASILPARGQGASIAGLAANAGIVFLFFLYGARLSPADAWNGMRQWRLQIAVLLSTFALFPLLGSTIETLAPALLPPALMTGLLFLSILPTTIQSSIAFTSMAKGNVAAALCAASTSNVLGVVITPLLAGVLLANQGVQLSFDVVEKIVLQLFAPFALGQALRPWVGAWIQQRKRTLSFLDRAAILLIIYFAFSRGVIEGLWSNIALEDLVILVALLAALLGTVLALMTVVARRFLRFDRADAVVLQFCGSNKSLASGLPMASVLFAGTQVGIAILPLMIFHQLQLVVCALLARHYGRATVWDELPKRTPTASL